jgi:hypothetical protein
MHAIPIRRFLHFSSDLYVPSLPFSPFAKQRRCAFSGHIKRRWKKKKPGTAEVPGF